MSAEGWVRSLLRCQRPRTMTRAEVEQAVADDGMPRTPLRMAQVGPFVILWGGRLIAPASSTSPE